MSQFEWVMTCFGGMISALMIALIFVARNGVASQKDLREIEERIGGKIEKIGDKIDNLGAKIEFLRGAASGRPFGTGASKEA